MEAQQILSRFCPKPSSLLLPSHKKLHTLPCVGPKNLGIQRLGCSYTEGKKKRVFCVRRTIEEEEVKEVKVGATMPVRRKKLAVFVSGGGSNFKSIHEASLKGSLHGDVLVLVTNKHDCGGAEYARNNGISVVLFPKVKDGSDGLSPSELVDTLRSFQVDFILLAGFLKLIPVELIRAYEKSILNIHPSLLPAFGGKGYYGLKVHKAVIASGVRYTSRQTSHAVSLELSHFVWETGVSASFFLGWLDIQVLQFISLTNIMTRGVSLLNVLSLYWLMTLQRSWLPGFSRRNTGYMWRWSKLCAKSV
ncbi:Phosphoribosylglycinamide formyltransferase [Arachis hypogaea]|nr:Phosphoribosylglycinamide formyltransferase [Arachis hypogaea]QHN86697.1 Phosphoribosylglycinamide formyltransferase [Arachis hypogaea]